MGNKKREDVVVTLYYIACNWGRSYPVIFNMFYLKLKYNYIYLDIFKSWYARGVWRKQRNYSIVINVSSIVSNFKYCIILLTNNIFSSYIINTLLVMGYIKVLLFTYLFLLWCLLIFIILGCMMDFLIFSCTVLKITYSIICVSFSLKYQEVKQVQSNYDIRWRNVVCFYQVIMQFLNLVTV